MTHYLLTRYVIEQALYAPSDRQRNNFMIKMTKRSDLHKYSIFNLQYSIIYWSDVYFTFAAVLPLRLFAAPKTRCFGCKDRDFIFLIDDDRGPLFA